MEEVRTNPNAMYAKDLKWLQRPMTCVTEHVPPEVETDHHITPGVLALEARAYAAMTVNRRSFCN